MSDHGVNLAEGAGQVPVSDAAAVSGASSRPSDAGRQPKRVPLPRTETVDWYSEGQSRTIILGDEEVHIRFVGRKGRRGRIVISAPPGARFRADILELSAQ